jgi:hypothetical protein
MAGGIMRPLVHVAVFGLQLQMLSYECLMRAFVRTTVVHRVSRLRHIVFVNATNRAVFARPPE